MTLPLSPDVLAAAYDFLAATEPFRRWNLPDSEDVRFRVVRSRAMFAQYVWEGAGADVRHTIEMSSATVGHTKTLLESLGHEMIHLHLRLTGMESRSKDPNVHNMAFRKLAADVCRIHGFDPKAFY